MFLPNFFTGGIFRGGAIFQVNKQENFPPQMFLSDYCFPERRLLPFFRSRTVGAAVVFFAAEPAVLGALLTGAFLERDGAADALPLWPERKASVNFCRLSQSLRAAVSRIECMPSMGMPMSAVGTGR